MTILGELPFERGVRGGLRVETSFLAEYRQNYGKCSLASPPRTQDRQTLSKPARKPPFCVRQESMVRAGVVRISQFLASVPVL